MSGIIRKIIIGPNPKDGMAYYVGMRAGEKTVSHILNDEEYCVKYRKTRYLVYIEGEDGTFLWKSIDDMPCIIEYDLNF